MEQRSLLPMLVVALCFALGCDRNVGPPSVAVSGSVTIDGRPLSKGYLYFRTIETGALEHFDIVDGEFQGKAQVGPRRVEVIASETKIAEIDGKDTEVTMNIVDPAFNIQSTLTAEVTLEGPNQFKFDVRRK